MNFCDLQLIVILNKYEYPQVKLPINVFIAAIVRSPNRNELRRLLRVLCGGLFLQTSWVKNFLNKYSSMTNDEKWMMKVLWPNVHKYSVTAACRISLFYCSLNFSFRGVGQPVLVC